MKGFTVNIADFRCWGVARATSTIRHRPTRRLDSDADLREEQAVYDIGAVRDARRLGHRTACGPISIERKAKVLRFNVIPIQIEARVEEARGAEGWSTMPDGSNDPPPAA
jgi:hypothetical protein